MTTEAVPQGLSFWTDPNNDWDRLVLGGVVWPGVWEISGQGVQRKIDLKKSKGADQATLQDEGYQNASLTASGIIWTKDQFRELQAVLPEVHPRRKGGDRQPLSIVHPQANLLGIDNVYLKSIAIPKLDKEKGGPLRIELGLIEWVPEPKTVKNAGGAGKGNRPKDTEKKKHPLDDFYDSLIDELDEGLDSAGELFDDAVDKLSEIAPFSFFG